jgi:hypothetical protein
MKEREAAPAERGSRSDPARAPRVSETRTVPMPPGVRTRLQLGKAGDAAERQADAAVGDRAPVTSPAAPSVDSDAPVATEVADELERPGAPLPAAARKHWERKLGADLGAVRVHHDGPARTSAERIDASAYTHGDHVVLGDGAGPDTVGHELTHVLQQRAAGGPPVVQRNERARREAQRMYDKNSIGATPESGNPIVLFEDDMTKDLNDKLKSGDYELIHEAFDNVLVWYNDDDIAYNMTKNLSDEELRALAARASGRLVLRKLWDEMDAGPTDDEDRVQMQRIETALSTTVTSPLTVFDDKGEIIPKAGKDDLADYPWLKPDRIKDKDQVRVRDDGTPTNNEGKPIRKGDPGWDHMVETAKWTITVPLASLSNVRLLSLARFAQWLNGNEPEKILGPDGVPKLGKRLGEVRDEMVRRLVAKAEGKKWEAVGPTAKMPDREPDPIDHNPAVKSNALQQLERIRNMGGFGSIAMVITIFATDDINLAINVGEVADMAGNVGHAAVAKYKANRQYKTYMGSGNSGLALKPNSYARGGSFGLEQFPVGQLPSKYGTQASNVPDLDVVLQNMKSGKSATYGFNGPRWEVTKDGFVKLRTAPPPDLLEMGAGKPLVIRLDNGMTIPLGQKQASPWMTPEINWDLKFPPGGYGYKPPEPKEMKPGVFVNLVSGPDGKVLIAEATKPEEEGQYELLYSKFEDHPNRKAIDANLAEMGIKVVPTELDAATDAKTVTVEVVGPNNEKFRRSRIVYQKDKTTSQHFHHELNHVLDPESRVQRYINDPAEFAKAKGETIDQLLKRSAPEQTLTDHQVIVRKEIVEIRNHLRDVDEYGMTVPKGGTEPVPTGSNWSYTKRHETISRMIGLVNHYATSPKLDPAQRAEMQQYVRNYINGAFPELPAEYKRLNGGTADLWADMGVPEKGPAK